MPPNDPLPLSPARQPTATPETANLPAGLPVWMTLLLATACGLLVANLYYAQPLAGPIAAALGMPPQLAGLVVTLTQLGYGAGLLLIVPLGDLLENRRLVLTLLAVETLALLVQGFATHPAPFLVTAAFIGAGAVAIQVLVPYAAHMTSEAGRGKAVGNVMSGLMLGIMLARPVSGFVADRLGWNAVFLMSAGFTVLLAGVLWRALPVRRPASGLSYGAMLTSMVGIARTTPLLRRRALYQAGMFGAFSLFWTAIPLYLAGPAFGLSQTGIALFALAGVAGAIAAPVAGAMADRGHSHRGTWLAMGAVAAAFVMTHLAPAGSGWSLGVLVAAAIVLDFGVSANLVLGQRTIFSLGAALRGRLNGLYMATFFAGGAAGSALGAWSYAHGGWLWTSLIGICFPLASMAYFSTERRSGIDAG
ncbi:MAG: MFS transporter [Comamonadaceae bacterium]|nr:MAG: MFS transporter [Comamonadaceae bacterium]